MKIYIIPSLASLILDNVKPRLEVLPYTPPSGDHPAIDSQSIKFPAYLWLNLAEFDSLAQDSAHLSGPTLQIHRFRTNSSLFTLPRQPTVLHQASVEALHPRPSSDKMLYTPSSPHIDHGRFAAQHYLSFEVTKRGPP